MSELKLFRTGSDSVSELVGGAVALERSLQTLFEKNLDALLGVRFLASEFVCDNGRMDSLGIDENGSPVIIEYKRATNENVINQGLFYLNWLMGHRKDFEWLVLERFGKEQAMSVDWSGPRLICIAGDFTKYDEHAVKEMDRNIDLIRYRKFEGDLLLLEHLTSVSAKTLAAPKKPIAASGPAASKKTVTDHLESASTEMLDRYHLIEDYLLALGDDVQKKVVVDYVAFRRIRNIACVQLRNELGKIIVNVRVDPDSVPLEDGFTRDMRKIGHYGTGDLEIAIFSDDDFIKAKPLLDRAYDNA